MMLRYKTGIGGDGKRVAKGRGRRATVYAPYIPVMSVYPLPDYKKRGELDSRLT